MYGKCNCVMFVIRLKSLTVRAGISYALSKIIRLSQISLRIRHINFCCSKASLNAERCLITIYAAIKNEEQAY
jgi:hypothetical protein